MSTVYSYSIPQRIIIRIGHQLVSWAEASAATAQARRIQRAEALWQRQQGLQHAEESRDRAVEAYLLLPRQH